jgi:hypothetical protein
MTSWKRGIRTLCYGFSTKEPADVRTAVDEVRDELANQLQHRLRTVHTFRLGCACCSPVITATWDRLRYTSTRM